jgi:hypothetical protein
MSIAGASGFWTPYKQHPCLHQRRTGKKAGRRLTTTPEGKLFFSVCRASSQRREVGVGVGVGVGVRGRKKADTDFDIVVVGAGIIGLTIANRILTTTNLSVAIVDAAQPCAGATGAGTSLCVPLCLCNVCLMCFFWAWNQLVDEVDVWRACVSWFPRARIPVDGAQESTAKELGPSKPKQAFVGRICYGSCCIRTRSSQCHWLAKHRSVGIYHHCALICFNLENSPVKLDSSSLCLQRRNSVFHIQILVNGMVFVSL